MSNQNDSNVAQCTVIQHVTRCNVAWYSESLLNSALNEHLAMSGTLEPAAKVKADRQSVKYEVRVQRTLNFSPQKEESAWSIFHQAMGLLSLLAVAQVEILQAIKRQITTGF